MGVCSGFCSVAVVKYPDKKATQGREGGYFSIQLQIIVRHDRGVKDGPSTAGHMTFTAKS